MDIESLRRACARYRAETDYDSTLAAFRNVVGQSIDVDRLDHAAALFRWLNAWQCRQFAVAYHGMAADSLSEWARRWLEKMPGTDRHLTDLSARELDVVALAYDDLRKRPASLRNLGGRQTTVTFGATGAAKALFALRPLIVPPWDEPIREALGYRTGSAGDFRAYLSSVAGQLGDLERSSGIKVADLPKAVGRPRSSPPKLIDEHNWINLTKGRRV